MQHKRLSQLRDELAAITSPYNSWDDVIAWVAKAKPVVRKFFPEDVADLETLSKPRWCELPRVGGSPRSESFNQQARASEIATNTGIAERARASILALMDSLVNLSEPAIHGENPQTSRNDDFAIAASTTPPAKAFISYSWDGPEHQAWVKDLAVRLREYGVDVTLDRWHLAPGDQLPQFMETAIRENDFVLIVCTSKYKQKSDSRNGGVGYEGDIMTGEVVTGQNARKFIPLLREGTWHQSAPTWLASKFYLNFIGEPYSEQSYQDLLNTLKGTREQAPPLGQRSMTTSSSQHGSKTLAMPTAQEQGPIRIVGIVVDDIGRPKNDGTYGSALYRVPFHLSRKPSSLWANHFVQTWNNPPSFSTMHRPGIASVVGDRIILDGTTVEEVDKYHRHTLKGVVDRVNSDVAEHEAKQMRADEQRVAQERKATESAAEAARHIKFD